MEPTEYRVAWTGTWDTFPREKTSGSIPTLTDAKAHYRYVSRDPLNKNVRVQSRTWTDLTT